MSVAATETLTRPAAETLPYWPQDRLVEAIAALCGKTPDAVALAAAMPEPGDAGRWMDWAGARFGQVVQELEAGRAELARILTRLEVAILWHPGENRFLALRGQGNFGLRLLSPDGRWMRVAAAAVAEAHAPRPHPTTVRQVRRVAGAAGLSGRQSAHLAQAIIDRVEADQPSGGIWALTPAPVARLHQAVLRRDLILPAMAVLALSLVAQAAEIGAWAIAGSGALMGAEAWRMAWILCLATALPVGFLAARVAAGFGRNLSRLIRQRLIEGALALPPGALRNEGTAGLLARGMEAQSFEGAVTQVALGSLAIVAQAVAAAWVLAQGAAPALTLGLWLLWLLVQAVLGLRFGAALRDWTQNRRDLTGRMVERMVGHRTVLAQETPAQRVAVQDRQLLAYLARSRHLDAASLPFMAGLPLGWMLLGIAALAPAYIAGASAVAVAVSLGGVVLAGRSLGSFSALLGALATARTAWAQIAPLANVPQAEPDLAPFMPRSSLRARADQPILQLADAQVAYPGRAALLHGCNLIIGPGDQILLEGPSGAGKSTLIRILSGQEPLREGSLQLHGQPSIGHPLHHGVVAATPQFHDNHIFAGPLAFNLLLGRSWPATPDDLQDARDICAKLGLSPLLQRMPGGLMTHLGDTGWQLSHGEKSRIFLARSLLQGASVVMLDESFAALDPDTLGHCLKAARSEADALLVVAHP